MVNKDIAINVSGVSKKFVLPHQKVGTIKSLVVNPFTKYEKETQMALERVSFDVKKGEFFGIVGRNGSGKSTLLKCMAGVYKPDSGSIDIKGSLVPFIELGVGFNSDLSGRDNVFLNGALLGFSRPEMEEMYDEIVEFAELEKFMDQKLRNYSSGMQVRLAFSIAIRAESDILLLDEVLAVGDSAFKQKCNDYFYNLKSSNRTIILVSHSMSSIKEYCDRAVLLENGHVQQIGSPQEIAYLYERKNKDVYLDYNKKNLEEERKKLLIDKNIDIKVYNKKNTSNEFKYGDEITVEIKFKDKRVKNVGIALYSKTGKYVFGANTYKDDFTIKSNKVSYSLKLNIADGNYFFKIALFGDDDKEKIDFIDQGPSFIIDSMNMDPKKWGGLVKLDHTWKR